MNILVINGHPYNKSFSKAIADEYVAGAQSSGHHVTLLTLADLEFNPYLNAGYREKQPLETDLQKAQELIKNSNHIVIITPIWWGGPTALLKGFLDRTLLPGFAFKYRPNSSWWDKFLTGRSARLFVLSDAPSWWMRFLKGDSTVKILKDSTLQFVGINPVKVSRYGDIKNLDENKRKIILEKVRKIGQAGK